MRFAGFYGSEYLELDPLILFSLVRVVKRKAQFRAMRTQTAERPFAKFVVGHRMLDHHTIQSNRANPEIAHSLLLIK